MKARILIADDHEVTRYGLRTLLEAAGFEVIAEASEGREALRLLSEQRPEVAFMDVSMPGLNGLEATRMLKDLGLGTRVIMLTMHRDSEHVHRALAAGAAGYLLKGSSRQTIVEAVRSVLAGRRYLSPELRDIAERPDQGARSESPLESLSIRERQVLQLVAEGRSSSEIASIVHISPKSVGTYRSRLMKKLGLADVPALVKFAIQHGITPPG